jgi:hypothetical protein
MMFLDCPAYLDEDGAERCGLPAEVCDRLTTPSTSGPIEGVRIRCPSGPCFNAPIEFLTWHAGPGIEQVAAAAVGLLTCPVNPGWATSADARNATARHPPAAMYLARPRPHWKSAGRSSEDVPQGLESP